MTSCKHGINFPQKRVCTEGFLLIYAEMQIDDMLIYNHLFALCTLLIGVR